MRRAARRRRGRATGVRRLARDRRLPVRGEADRARRQPRRDPVRRRRGVRRRGRPHPRVLVRTADRGAVRARRRGRGRGDPARRRRSRRSRCSTSPTRSSGRSSRRRSTSRRRASRRAVLADVERLVARGAAAIGLDRGPGARRGARRRHARRRPAVVLDRGGGPHDRRPVRAHAAVRRRHRARGGRAAPRARDGPRRPRPPAGRRGRDDAADPPRRRAANASTGATTRSRCRASSGSRSPCPSGHAVVPLPESDRYLGFLFARADTPGRGRDRPASRRRGARYRHHLMPDAVEGPARLHLRARPLPDRRGHRRRRAARSRPRGPGRRPRRRRLGSPTPPTWADRVAISVPMHTAARLAHELAPRIDVPIGCFGLYAGMCADIGAALVGRDPVAEVVRWVEDDPTVTVDRDRPGARPAPRTRPVRAPHPRRRPLPGGRHRRVGRLRAPLPPLPGPRRLRRSDPHHRRRHRAGRRRARRSRPARGT